MKRHSKDARPTPPEIVLLLENPRKGNNLGSILRCATAAGVRQILTVGFDKCAVQGSHGSYRHVRLVAFPTAAQAAQALPPRTACIGLLGAVPEGYHTDGYAVCVDQDSGLATASLLDREESEDSLSLLGRSYPIYALPSALVDPPRTVCLVVSKDRHGLPVELARQCEAFCHVPCVGLQEGPPLLDTPSTLTIALHQLTASLGYDEVTFEGHKFHVIKPPMADRSDQQQQQREKRKEKDRIAESVLEEGDIGVLLGHNETGDY
jgi:predicted RNA binding protein YcfA (HicA-like mRNA interferase family)